MSKKYTHIIFRLCQLYIIFMKHIEKQNGQNNCTFHTWTELDVISKVNKVVGLKSTCLILCVQNTKSKLSKN